MTERRANRQAQQAPSLLERLSARFFEREDIAWLGAFRILFGLTMCVSMVRFLAFGWVDDFFVKPKFHFKYWGFGWVEPLPAPLLHVFFGCMAVLAFGIATGALFRFCASAFAVGFAYIQLLDVTTYLNHYYLANLLAVLLAISPAHRVWSIDTWRTGKRAKAVPRGWLWIFRFQIGVVYTFAGLAKAQSDWLVHAAPLRLWLGSRTGMPWLGPLLASDWSAPLMSWTGFLFDTSIVWLLLVSRIRPVAYCFVLVFHAVTGTLFPIGMFPVIMVLGALVFFPSAWPVRWTALARVLANRIRSSSLVPRTLSLATKTGVTSQRQPSSGTFAVARAGRPEPPRYRRAILAAALLYCGVQVAMPLRHWAYGGNVLWDEQGMRWSWRVMVREKNGAVTYVVRDMQGNEFSVAPRRYLTRLQEREMSGQPDLILQLAHHVRDEFEKRLGRPVAVRADAIASLNGRRPARLIDPTVDLAAIEDGVGKARWILPLRDETPPATHAVVAYQRHAGRSTPAPRTSSTQ